MPACLAVGTAHSVLPAARVALLQGKVFTIWSFTNWYFDLKDWLRNSGKRHVLVHLTTTACVTSGGVGTDCVDPKPFLASAAKYPELAFVEVGRHAASRQNSRQAGPWQHPH